MPVYNPNAYADAQRGTKKPTVRAATTSERLLGKIDETVGPAMRALARLTGLDTPQGQIEATFPTPAGPVAPMMAKAARGAGKAVQPMLEGLEAPIMNALKNRSAGIIHGRGDRPLNVAVAMEQFGNTREAFRNLGHNATSIDLAADRMGSPHHIQDDVFKVLEEGTCGPLDLVLGHPTCTHLSSSGIHWNDRGRGWEKTEQGVRDFLRLFHTPAAEHVAVENPVGIMSSRFRPADQYIQPYEFGSDASKRTGLWLRNLDPLIKDPAQFVEPSRTVGGLPRWGNQTGSGQNVLGPSADRAMQRAQTYPGIAKAIAEQFSEQILRKMRGLQ